MKTEALSAEALLDKRLRVNIPAPWFLRLFKIYMIPLWFKRPVYAQLLRISRKYVQMGIELDKLEKGEAMTVFADIAKHGVTASQIIALGLIRGSVSSTLFYRLLAWYLRNRLDAQSMAELTKLIVFLSGGEDFVNIIRSVTHMRVTTPILSHQKTVS